MWPRRAAALVLALTLTSCSKAPRTAQGSSAPPPSQAPAAAAPAATPGGAAAPPPTLSPQTDPKRTITLAQERPPAAAPAAVRQNADVSSLLSLARDGRTLPEDFKIGSLGDRLLGDSDEQQALSVAGSFLARLSAGKIDDSLLAGSSAGRLTDMLQFGIQRGDVPRSFRIGAPKKHESGEVSANVRLFGQEGTSEGEIFMTRAGGHWLVSDFQISMDDLKVKQEKSKERFFPSSYRWMLQE